jgi:2-polyprenyl-3-methyl-5-hydroxy-6-metoxy-1,4-benzoquinol methylase
VTLACPICGAAAAFVYPHPEARIYHCQKCTHTFSDPATLEHIEQYSPDYYEEEHRNWFAHPNIRLFRWIERQLPSNIRSVIDVGCGRGQFLDFLRLQRPDLRLVGVDLSPTANRDNIEFHCGNAFELELGTFDAIVSLATIEHIEDASGFARRLYSLCNPGGIVVVMTINEDSLMYRMARAARRIGMTIAFDRLYSAHHLHHFSTKSFEQVLARNGLRVRNRLDQSMPVRAIDVPGTSPLVRPIFFAGAAALLTLGDWIGLSFLQTIVAVRPMDA